MNPVDLYKFSQEGGIGTCISKIDVPAGKDRLPRRAGDIITILKPITDNLYLGSVDDIVGHFHMEDVNLIYLNLTSASPRRNPEKYMSFTALLEQKVPTGSIHQANMSPFTGPSSLASSPISTIDSVEHEGSLEDLTSEAVPGNLTKKPSLRNKSSTIDSSKDSLPLLRHNEPQHTISTLDFSSGSSLILPHSKSKSLESIERSIPAKPESSDSKNITESNDPKNKADSESSEDKCVPDSTDDKVDSDESKNEVNSASNEVSSDRHLPQINLSKSDSKETSTRVLYDCDSVDSDINSNTLKHSEKGLFSSFRKLKLKTEELVTSVKLDPSLMLLPSSKPSSPMTSLKMGAASSSSANLRQFYIEAQSNGQSMTVDEFGFIVGVSDDEGDDSRSVLSARSANSASPNGNKTDKMLKFDLTKEAKWRTIMNNWTPTRARKSYRVKKLVENGIPDLVRGRAWEFLANSHGVRKSGVYKTLLEKEKIPIYDVIERDIRRTYPKHAMFYYESSQGQQELHSILKAYAQYNPEVGYCQGMGMLVGLFLMQGLEGEEAFWLLVATVNQYLQGYFTPKLEQLHVHAAVFEKLLEEYDPRLAKHLSSNDITPLLYVTPWFLTVFTLTLPWSSVLRVWDLFFYKGVKILFRVGLAIMTCVRAHLLRNCPTNADLLPFLLHIPHSFIEPEPLMAAYKNVKITTAHIQTLCRKIANPDGKGPE